MSSRRKRKKPRGTPTTKPPVERFDPPASGGPDAAKAPSPRGLRFFPLFMALALASAVAGYWFLGRGRLSDGEPQNVLIVTADTFRADRLGVYGGPVPTPNLDRLAGNGVVFERAMTAVPVTLPSHASLFTGTYPFLHGVRDNGGRPLAARNTTLAEVLRENGYATGGFVGAFVLDRRWGLDQGFDVYSDGFDEEPSEGANRGETQRSGGEVLDDALPWMASVEDRRFFAWVHLFDAHTPYEPPAEFRRGTSVSDLYDGELAYVDHLVGRLLDWLEREGLAQSTVVVFVGDHGESLGEHGEKTHGFFVYDATMRVPLLLRAPRKALTGRRVPELVRTIDVLPTVLELVGVESPRVVEGRSLVALSEGRESGAEPSAYGESFFPAHYGWSPLKSLWSGTLHLVDAPRPELYDVAADPGETENLASSRAGTVRRLTEELRSVEESSRPEFGEASTDASVDPETEAKLRALGYLGGAPAASTGGEEANPKDKIHLFLEIREAAALAEAGRSDEAAATIERVLEEDPKIAEAHRMLGDYQLARGRPAEAAASFGKALALDDRYAPAVFGLASAFHAEGRLEDAAAGFERALTLDPSSASAVLALVRVRLEQRLFERAIELLAAHELPESELAAGLRLEAEAYTGLGRLDEAEERLRTALAEDPRDADVHRELAVLAEKRGDPREAVSEYEKALDSDPGDYEARFNLAKLLGQLGREGEMLTHLEQAIEANPRFALGYLYLANAVLERGDLARALTLAQKGLSLEPEPALAALGHFILADVYDRTGRKGEAARELAKARRLQELAPAK